MKILFQLTLGANPLLEYRFYDDAMTAGDSITAVFVSDAKVSYAGTNVTFSGIDIAQNSYHYEDILKAGLVPATSAVDAYNYLNDLFGAYLTASRGTGGGGGGDATAANQATQIGLATTANTLLTEIRNDARLQREFSESIWVDATSTFFVRRVVINETTGAETIVNTLPDGTPYVPTAPTQPAGSAGTDIEIKETLYRAINGGVGYNIDDVITQVKLIQTVSPFGVVATIYFNNTTNAVITPLFADLQVFLPNNNTGSSSATSLLFRAIEDDTINSSFVTGDFIVRYTTHNVVFSNGSFLNEPLSFVWFNVTQNIQIPDVADVSMLEFFDGSDYNLSIIYDIVRATNTDGGGRWIAGDYIERLRYEVFVNGGATSLPYTLHRNLRTNLPSYFVLTAINDLAFEPVGASSPSLTSIQNNVESKMSRIKGASDYTRIIAYHNPLVIGSNVTSITHTGTTAFGFETITETFTYVDVATAGSNVTQIAYS